MAILKCKICGGDMEISPDKTFGICEYCGSTMTLPKINDDVRAEAFNRGNHFRRAGEFDKALSVYEKIVEEDPNDAEAHWCAALCRFGIEWVEDPTTMEYLPTCHRASFDLFSSDIDCVKAIELSDGITKKQYMKDAAKIAEVQKGILATSQNENPFDVFICYKETDQSGNRTVDSTLAQEIYYQLVDQGLRVFFARITLEDKVGSEYEPYIFAALNSAKAMVVVGTKPEHFNAVWVKNEWSRYLSIVKHDRSKVLIPCYRDMDPYDLPEQLSILQSYDMSKIGFIQDLIRGIKKITAAEVPKGIVKGAVVADAVNANTAPLLERAFLFLEDGKWQDADIYCEKVLDIDPKNAEAYLGKLMADLQVRTRKQLADCAEPFDDRENYGKVIRFGDEKLEAEMRGYITHIIERNENARLTGIYNGAVSAMDAAYSETAFKAAAETFKTIPGFHDADSLAEQCLDKAEVCRKDAIYASARTEQIKNSIAGCESAIDLFESISGWKDADEQIYACRKEIEEIKAKEEADREERRIANAKAAKKRRRVVAISISTIILCISFVIILITVIIPNKKYNNAIQLINTGKYVDAYELLSGLNRFKDSQTKVKEIQAKYITQKLRKSTIGDCIVFGSYEQDNNISNGNEAIEWLIIDERGNDVLLISKFNLDCRKYCGSENDWKNSEIRKYLNDSFFNIAFDTNIQNIIKTTTLTDTGTSDKVFLLSKTEAEVLFSDNYERCCSATAWAIAQVSFLQDGKNTNGWFLRSNCDYLGDWFAYSVLPDGSLSGVSKRASRGIRPALWINLES